MTDSPDILRILTCDLNMLVSAMNA